MTTAQVLIVSLTVLAVAIVIAVAKWRIDADALTAQEAHAHAQEAAAAAAADRRADADAAAPSRALGPEDGAKLGVHIGGQLIQGTRVMRGDRNAEGWIVLDDAELLEGSRATPLGGNQWIRGADWMQVL